MEGEFRIIAHTETVNIIAESIGDRKSCLSKLTFEGGCSRSVYFFVVFSFEICDCGICGGEEIIGNGIYTETCKLLYIFVNAL